MKTDLPTIPDRLFRNEMVHRALRRTSPDVMISCGFMLKPEGRGQHVDSVFTLYSGVLVLRGDGRYIDWTGREHRTFPGCFLQRIPGRRHSTIHPPEADWAECYINISRGFAESLAAQGTLDMDRPVLLPGLSLPLVERFDGLLADMRTAPPGDLPRMLVRIHELIVDIYSMDRKRRRHDRYARILDEAAHRLAAEADKRTYIPELAAELGLGYESFRKSFRARFGLSPGDYAIRRRMERARSLLAQGELTVKEVSFALGYPSEFAFSRQFSHVFGAPPSRFRGMP